MKFSKISFESFKKDMINFYIGKDTYTNIKMKESYDEKIKKAYDNIKIPTRSTLHSAGYDFIIPFDLVMDSVHTTPDRYTHRNKVEFIPTGINIELDDDKILILAPRSSSSKKKFMLGNTIGIIDPDYIKSDNEGDIIISIREFHTHSARYYEEPSPYGPIIHGSIITGYPVDNSVYNESTSFKAGDKIAQGIITNFYTVENDNAEQKTRNGGFGSTGN